MAFWERNTIIIGLGSLIGGGVYFGIVFWQSLSIGVLAAPSLPIWLGYIVVQFAVSTLGVLLTAKPSQIQEIKLVPGGTDERDKIIRSKAETAQGHLLSGFIFVALAAWFAHGNIAIFFHSIVAALLMSELGRCGVQWYNYNRAV